MITAFSYIRFSTPEQRKGDSLRRQMADTITYCNEHKLKLDKTLTLRDLGVSAFRGKNVRDGALGVFLGAVRAGTVPRGSVLIVENLDRLTRADVLTAQELFIGILRSGIEIVTLMDRRRYSEAAVIDNPMELMASIMVMMRAHEESKTKSIRGKKAWERKLKKAAQDKQPFSARCPSWLTFDSKARRFDKIIERVKVIHDVRRLVLEGNGTSRIAKNLNAKQVAPFQRKKKEWNEQSVRWLLKDRALIGECTLASGKTIEGYYPSVMTDAEFYGMRSVIRARHTTGYGKRDGNVVNLFGRLVVSAADGAPMIIRRGLRDCKLVSQKCFSGGSWSGFSYPVFEEAFLRWVSEVAVAKVEQPVRRIDELKGLLAEKQGDIMLTNRRLAKASGLFRIKLYDVLQADAERVEELQRQIEDEQAKKGNCIDGTVAQVACRDLLGQLLLVKDPTPVRLAIRESIARLVSRIELHIGGNGDLDRMAVADVKLADGSHRWLAIRKQRGLPAVSFGTVKPIAKEVDGHRLLRQLVKEFSLLCFAAELGYAKALRSDFFDFTAPLAKADQAATWMRSVGLQKTTAGQGLAANIQAAKAELDRVGAKIGLVEKRDDGSVVVYSTLEIEESENSTAMRRKSVANRPTILRHRRR